jgi:hypothetical protein
MMDLQTLAKIDCHCSTLVHNIKVAVLSVSALIRLVVASNNADST